MVRQSSLPNSPGGPILLVMRGSNDKRPALPSYRWHSLSSGGGRHWTAPAPWIYANGEPFFSPNACSQLLPHPTGRLSWLGTITPANPRGNRPRYPFVPGEVDRRGGLLLRESVRVIDDRATPRGGWDRAAYDATGGCANRLAT